MSDTGTPSKATQLEPELAKIKLEEGAPANTEGGMDAVKADHQGEATFDAPSPHTLSSTKSSRSSSTSAVKLSPSAASAPDMGEREETVGGDITLTMTPGKAPKLSRTASQKVVSRPPPLYLDLPDATEDAKSTFGVLTECTYGNKYLGTTDHALECDCSEEWDPVSRVNKACGDDSDCINRLTKMECVGDCGCGPKCQNQRFSRKKYADVAVIKTEKKGFGLRANRDLRAGDFIFEYIGEVIDERTFRRRMLQYDQEGIKHFYFMSLTKGEFVDATKKGNLGRFCNHSCNPNCFVDKWVIRDKLRMGIFAERNIKAGEELVFNYNVDRYGADPQPCYCGEPNCTGFIGGRTQTDNATKLSHATIEALGIDDGDSWDIAVARKPRKKKASEDDEEYVNNLMPKGLEESGVNKVMAALRQCTEKWVAVKLLSRLQGSVDDDRVGHRIIRVHGYQIIKSTITAWKDDTNVILQALDILHRLPRITRNKIQDSKIEETIEELKAYEDERVQTEAAKLLEAWSKLEIAYRIPRMKRDPNDEAPARINHFERREKGRERSRSRSNSPSKIAPKGPAPKGPAAGTAPTAPRAFGRNAPFFPGPRPPRPRVNPLPPGWFQATSKDNGAIYYYNASGSTQWTRPTLAAHASQPVPKVKSNEQKLQDIISSITANNTVTSQASKSTTPQSAEEPVEESAAKVEKWQSWPQEKQEKAYENTLHPHVMSVAKHYRHKLDKEDLKRLSKEAARKLMRGDFKHGKVKDPRAKLDPKHEHTVKKFVKGYLDKAVEKKSAREQAKAGRGEKDSKERLYTQSPAFGNLGDTPSTPAVKSEMDKPTPSDNEDIKADFTPSSGSPSSLKRKREEDGGSAFDKRSKTDMQPTPPPPPPPPVEDMPMDTEIADEVGMGVEEDAFYTHIDDGSNGVAVNGNDGGRQGVKPNSTSPKQLATPSTGSCEHEHETEDGEVRKDATLGTTA